MFAHVALERALCDAAAVLTGAGIPYALIGGVAVAIHTAWPRAAEDVDLAVRVRCEDLIVLKERAAADPRRRRSMAPRDRSGVEMLRGDVPGHDEGW